MIQLLRRYTLLLLLSVSGGSALCQSTTGAGSTETRYAAETTYTQDFNNCTSGASLVGGWTQFSVTGTQTWACTTYGTTNPQTGAATNAVQMSGYSGSSRVNEDWLISPALDLSTAAAAVLSFNYRTAFAGNSLVVKVSTNYSGTGSPTVATWADLATLPANSADVWQLLENVSLQANKSANTRIAYVYTSTSTTAARWTIDNFKVQVLDTYISTSNLDLVFEETAVGGASAAKTFTFQAQGYTDAVVVTAPENFELSKNGTDYATSLTYTAAEAQATNTVYVRFKPTASQLSVTGAITFTSGATAVNRGALSGSSIVRSSTLDVATWNMEWFGSTSYGPSNEQLQYDNAKKVISELKADIIGVQEVVDAAKVQALAQELGYSYESMSTYLSGTDQKIGFIYNPQVVRVKRKKELLAKLLADVRSGAATLPGYPVSANLFWSNGRLPLLVEFEATINGVKQTFSVVNIHAKANTSTDPTQDYDRRAYDVRVLRDTLNAQYANANLIILGDYNDDVDVSVVANKPSSYSALVTDNNYVTLTYTLSEAGGYTYGSGSLRSFLDHMIISASLTDEYIAGSIAVEEQFLNSVSDFRNTTSDHLPVSARFFLSPDNATGIASATKGLFKVYPNPAGSYVKLELPDKVARISNIELSVWSVDGRRVFETTGKLDDAAVSLSSAIRSLAKGVYVIKIHAGSDVYQARLLKH